MSPFFTRNRADEAEPTVEQIATIADQIELINRYYATGQMSEQELLLKQADIREQLAYRASISPELGDSQLYRDLGPAVNYAA